MIDIRHRHEGLEGEIGPHLGVSSSVACVVDYFGPTELLTMNAQGSTMDHDAPDSPESLLVGGPIQEHKERAQAASPVSFVTAEDKPILIIHGTEDRIVPADMGRELAEMAPERITWHPVPGADHNADPRPDSEAELPGWGTRPGIW